MQDTSLDACLALEPDTCALFLEEDCSYTGDLLLEIPSGEVHDAEQCEAYCKSFENIGCKYWVYQETNENITCRLLSSGDRTCNCMGGPEDPPLNECRGNVQ